MAVLPARNSTVSLTKKREEAAYHHFAFLEVNYLTVITVLIQNRYVNPNTIF